MKRPRVRISTLMLMVFVVALIMALVVQEARMNNYRRLAELEARRAVLEVKAAEAARLAAESRLRAAQDAMGSDPAK